MILKDQLPTKVFNSNYRKPSQLQPIKKLFILEDQYLTDKFKKVVYKDLILKYV